MKWEGGRKSSNVDDRRSTSGDGKRGMPSMGTIMMIWPIIKPLFRTKLGWVIIGLGAAAYFAGFNPLSLITERNSSYAPVDQAKDDKNAAFISTVLASTEDIWKKELRGYSEPTVVLYRGSTQSGCGYASAQMGPFYCPTDQKVYLDLGFFDELAHTHNAPGDFAQAYVLAHEIGHHIQNLQGTLSKVQKAKQNWGNSTKSNALQVKVELQADCYAGAWAYHAHKDFDILEPGDVEEALRAASSIGDDTLQRKSQGYVRPDAFTHGSSKQRVEWFRRGFQSGDIRQCNTFE
ncbi:neutral zinc metallopeptidase [Sulfurovum sp.]|uniref:KPN_02809 family neutral zinc metallopeptidase n=1 Tax=Sulfurovum sp. TaxID=1969726 RepID=UPI002867C08F|nr:neutral zinc metallopeptidase [Sulfurovum sp.]